MVLQILPQVAPVVSPPASMSFGWAIALSVAGSAAATALLNGLFVWLNAGAQRKWEIRKWETERGDTRRRRAQKAFVPLLEILQRFHNYLQQPDMHHRLNAAPSFEEEFKMVNSIEHYVLNVKGDELASALREIAEFYRAPKPPATPAEMKMRTDRFAAVFAKTIKLAIIEFRETGGRP